MNLELAEKALEDLRPGLAADGFDLRLGTAHGICSIEVILEAMADACRDCLIPDDMLVTMIESAIRSSEPLVEKVRLTKTGFGPRLM